MNIYELKSNYMKLQQLAEGGEFDEEAICPECGKSLDDCPARDFIVFDLNHEPSLLPQDHRCGWCDAELLVFPTRNNTIIFMNRY